MNQPGSAELVAADSRSASTASIRVARVAQIVGFTLLSVIGAKIRVPIPFTPVPATLQILPVLLAGLFLGARGGAASQIAYLALGLAGVPVFALPGGGPGYLLGPTGGYLIGFVAAAFVTGTVCGRDPRPGTARMGLALLAGTLVLHICGFA